jgi:hypothetical protein
MTAIFFRLGYNEHFYVVEVQPRVVLPFGETRMKKFQPVPKIRRGGASKAPLTVTILGCPVEGYKLQGSDVLL